MIDLVVLDLRLGSCVHDWLLRRPGCVERTPTTAVTAADLLWISTWWMEKLEALEYFLLADAHVVHR